MKSTFLLIVTLNLPTVFLTGCGQSADPLAPVKKLYKPSPDTDVTASPKYNFAPFSGTIWKTKLKTAVAEGKRYTGAPETSLIVPSRFDPTDPNYRPVPGIKIIAVIPEGTRLRIERLMKDNGASGSVQVTATVEDGTNTQRTVFLDGRLLLNNMYLLFEMTKSTNWGVNPEFLEPGIELK